MSKEQAVHFLERMLAEPELQARIREGYRRLLCDTGREEGLTFSPEELQQAFLEEKDRMSDETLASVAGGLINTTFTGNPTWGGPNNTTGGVPGVFI